VLVSDKVAEPLYAPGATLLHGITFGGHPVAAAVALANIEIFKRDHVLENVREQAPWLREQLEQQLRGLPIVADVRGAGFFLAFELVGGEYERRFDAGERERLLRGFLPRRLREAGLIARADDRGDSVLQIAPPLISTREQLAEMVSSLAEVLSDAGDFMGL
jgi:adenosylmethionine-8-amino-7-oxononanoate aminotransferase